MDISGYYLLEMLGNLLQEENAQRNIGTNVDISDYYLLEMLGNLCQEENAQRNIGTNVDMNIKMNMADMDI